MKKIIITIIMSLCIVGIAAPALSAPNILDMTGKVAVQSGYDVANVNAQTLSTTIGQLIRAILSLLGTIFLVLVIYAGILWMTASGNDEQVKKAVGIITNATVGLVIALSAYSIVTFVLMFSVPKKPGVTDNKVKCESLHSGYTGYDSGNSNLDYNANDASSGERIAKSAGCALVTLGEVIVSPLSWLWKTDVNPSGTLQGQNTGATNPRY